MTPPARPAPSYCSYSGRDSAPQLVDIIEFKKAKLNPRPKSDTVPKSRTLCKNDTLLYLDTVPKSDTLS